MNNQNRNIKKGAAILGCACLLLTACGAAEDSASTEATETVTTGSVVESTQEASTTNSTQGSTQAATQTTTASTEASTAAASASPIVDGQIQYSDDLVNTMYGDDALMNIVVLGDSQFGNFKGYDGLAYQISQYCHANVWNCGIGGATAAVLPSDSTDKDGWDSLSGVGVAYALTKQVSSDYLATLFPYQKYMIDSVDMSKVDVFIVEFGLNDYLENVELDRNTTERSYRNAEATIGRTLHKAAPDAKIIFCGPTYAQFFDGTTYLGDINTLANKQGYKLIDYCNSLENEVTTGLAAESDVYSYFNAYLYAGIDSTNATDMLSADRLHMNGTGRTSYAKVLSRIIIRDEGYSIDEGVDPTTVEWWTTKTQ